VISKREEGAERETVPDAETAVGYGPLLGSSAVAAGTGAAEAGHEYSLGIPATVVRTSCVGMRRSVVEDVKPEPSTVTVWPPVTGRTVGETEVMVGAVAAVAAGEATTMPAARIAAVVATAIRLCRNEGMSGQGPVETETVMVEV